MTYVPGDEYRYPQYAKRGPLWECCVENRTVGYGATRKAALRSALRERDRAYREAEGEEWLGVRAALSRPRFSWWDIVWIGVGVGIAAWIGIL